MSNFLWVEDFEGGAAKQTFDQVFNRWLAKYPIDSSQIPDNPDELRNWLKDYGIYTELTFWDGYQFVKDDQKMGLVDYIVLDIDLKVNDDEDGDNQQLAEFLAIWYNYQAVGDDSQEEQSWKTATSELKKVAGYHLFVELVFKQGFPVDHILFSSNHGGQLASIASAFHAAKIESPKIYDKTEDEATKWIARKAGNKYSRLRRGIILGCQWLRNGLDDESIRVGFNKFIRNRKSWLSTEEAKQYLIAIEGLLPLNPPSQKDKYILYRVLLSSIAREWDKADLQSLDYDDKRDIIATYGRIMKLVRNWSVHSCIFDQLREEDIAFLFIINMRSFFGAADAGKNADSSRSYETYLFNIFEHAKATNELTKKINQWDLPLVKTYLDTKNLYETLRKDLKERDNRPLYFREIVRELQLLREQYPNNDEFNNQRFIAFLYQLFWLDPPDFKLTIGDSRTNLKGNQISATFKFYKYGFGSAQRSHVFDVARHVFTYAFH